LPHRSDPMHHRGADVLDRRSFIAGTVAAVAAARVGYAQPSTKVPRVGMLIHGPTPTPEQLARSPLRQGLRDLGWVIGQDLLIEAVYTEGLPERLPELAAELVRRRVDVIWCNGPPSSVAAARATKTIPIVMWGVALPVEFGLIQSLARPGGNVTGFAHSVGLEMLSKLLEVLNTLAPGATRVAMFASFTGRQGVDGKPVVATPAIEPALRQFGMQAERFALEEGEDLPRLLTRVIAWKADAVFAFGDPATFRERRGIVDFANRHRLPSVFGMKEFVAAGGLASYGADTADTVRRSAAYIDRILKGAKPADLPVEQPSKFELVINAKTARAIGVSIPPALLLRADQVIE
jgi:putative ABC transport system substrate-binding protein